MDNNNIIYKYAMMIYIYKGWTYISLFVTFQSKVMTLEHYNKVLTTQATNCLLVDV